MVISRRFAVAIGTAALLAAAPVMAAPYTAEYVFGDSLSDNGNLAEAYYRQNLPNPPSYNNSFTNGPVAVALLANKLGLNLTPSLWLTGFRDVNGLFGSSFTPGTNYAVAGATSAAQAVGGPAGINLPQQIAGYGVASGGRADPNALYVVDIGGNDVRNAARNGTGQPAISTAVQTELAAVSTLLAEGAKNLLVVNVPNVGVIPEFVLGQPAAIVAAATAYSQFYDAQLAQGLAALMLPSDSKVTAFDLYGFNTNLLATAGNYGLTNSTTPCYTNSPLNAATSAACGPNAQNIGQFYYWDAIHPTATVHALWATGFESALNVPEPSSVAMLGIGLVGLLGLARRKVSAAR